MLAAYVPGSGERRASIGRQNWEVRLPSGPLTLLQIGIGIIDLGFCALAMYMLVPNEPRSSVSSTWR